MERQITGKEIVRDMEYLIKLLHKEWERSGRTKAAAVITLEEADTVFRKFAAKINEKQQLLEEENCTFKESMELSKENFILLRLVKKMKQAGEKVNKKGMDMEFSVELDAEEYRVFRDLVLVKE